MPENGRNNLSLLASHHVFYSITIVGNGVVTIVYWTILHEKLMVKHAESEMRQWH